MDRGLSTTSAAPRVVPTPGSGFAVRRPAAARPLVVVSHRRWHGEELAAGGAAVIGSLGLDVPWVEPGRRPSWWMPQEFAVRLAASGAGVPLLSAGARWLADIDCRFTGRPVFAAHLSAAVAAGAHGWCKPAEAKIDRFPAAWRTAAEFRVDAAAAGLPADCWVQWCPVRLDLAAEYRCWVLDGRVTTAGLYLADGVPYDGGAVDADREGLSKATAFATEVVTALAEDQPPAYTLDVGRLPARRLPGSAGPEFSAERHVVVEANAAWSSGWYGCDLTAVRETIDRSCPADPAAVAPGGVDHRWSWVPDAFLRDRAARMRPLPAARPLHPAR
jgi:hypothetical protein